MREKQKVQFSSLEEHRSQYGGDALSSTMLGWCHTEPSHASHGRNSSKPILPSRLSWTRMVGTGQKMGVPGHAEQTKQKSQRQEYAPTAASQGGQPGAPVGRQRCLTP